MFEDKGEPKRIQTEVPLLTSLTLYRCLQNACLVRAYDFELHLAHNATVTLTAAILRSQCAQTRRKHLLPTGTVNGLKTK